MSQFLQPKPPKNPLAFAPCQIVYLEHHAQRLYAEVIQTVETKQICWVRPLILTKAAYDPLAGATIADDLVYDLRECSDLLLPLQFFRAALDTEVIPLVMHLGQLPVETQIPLRSQHNQHMQHFVRQVCLAHPEAFVSR